MSEPVSKRVVESSDDTDTSGSFIANPRAPKPDRVIEEGAGVVTSDSLAAESLRDGGSFADGNTVAGPNSAKASTASNTDTSGATVLAPAANSQSRDVGLEDYTPRGPGGTSDGAYDTSKGGPQDAFGGQAPGYVSTVTGDAIPDGRSQPKGTNLTEGGFDSEAPNASFNTNIDSKNDPGRVGLRDAEKANATAGADSGYPDASARADAGSGKGGFENLDAERQA